MDLKFGMSKFFDTGNLKMMVSIRENEIFNVILAFEEQQENFQNGSYELKFDMGEFFDTGIPNMMVPIHENKIFNMILAFRQQRTKKLMVIF